MADYEYIFSTSLHGKLKEKIYGRIFVKVTYDDKLFINIIREREDINFTMYINDFSAKILNGYTSEYAVYEVLKAYKKFILKKYFV